jgi:hypothetical protein
MLLLVMFLLGPQLLGTSWFSYLGADGLAVLVLVVVFTYRSWRKAIFALAP